MRTSFISEFCRTMFFSIFLMSFLFAGCKKLMNIDPPIQDIVGSEIYNSNITATSVLTGIYTDMSYYGIFDGRSSVSIANGLLADELISIAEPDDILSVFYNNSLTRDEGGYWRSFYGYIFRLNAAIEGVTASSSVSVGVKNQLLGEAKFTRAFMYFYLVNLYGAVPLLTTTDIKINSSAKRTDVNDIYQFIIQDLEEAIANLNEQYLSGDVSSASSERVRPNKYAAMALLSRTYLYTKQWSLAEKESSAIINNSAFYRLENLSAVFLNNSKEAIWQLQPVTVGQSTLDATVFSLASDPLLNIPSGPNPINRPVYLSDQIFGNFEEADNRKTIWIDSVIVDGKVYPYAFKYKEWINGGPRTESLTVLRLAEQYLIRAEARAMQGKLIGSNSAMEDIDMIRSRAGLPPSDLKTLNEILDLIISERRSELFTEWGHRWLDLKRTNRINDVMNVVSPLKGGNWSSYKALYPIPIHDIISNPALKGSQNPGYPEQ